VGDFLVENARKVGIARGFIFATTQPAVRCSTSRNRLAEGKLPLCAEMCSTKSLLAVDGDIIAQIYKERVSRRGYGSGAWGWQTAYRETIGS
jgi:formate dehydrogenase iron-sulfur subunit